MVRGFSTNIAIRSSHQLLYEGPVDYTQQCPPPPPHTHTKIKSLEKHCVHVFKNIGTDLQEYGLQSALLSSRIWLFTSTYSTTSCSYYLRAASILFSTSDMFTKEEGRMFFYVFLHSEMKEFSCLQFTSVHRQLSCSC